MTDLHKVLFTVIAAQPALLTATISECLKPLRDVSVRSLSLDDDIDLKLGLREVAIIDFTALTTPSLRTRGLELAERHLCLALLSPDMQAKGEGQGLCGECLPWPGRTQELAACLQRLAQQARAEPDLVQSLTLRLNLIGDSPAFRHVIGQVHKYARCDAPVMILGETGTGKEKIARAIHYLGLDEGTPFVAVNCGALPDSLVENEFFGHVRGAYTDARHAQKGLVEQAAGGALFLDEIEALSPKGQVALLRFLQEYEYRPLGADETRRAPLRLITASNEPLVTMVKQGRFRKDLYYRINILSLQLPPLRERGGDVRLLAEYFLDKYRQRYRQFDKYLDATTLLWMSRHDWPGNVRELENLILREFLLAETPCISISANGSDVNERRKNPLDRRCRHLYSRNFQEAKGLVVQEFERGYLQHVLDDTQGNISQAARMAGKERRTFAKLLDKHGLRHSGSNQD